MIRRPRRTSTAVVVAVVLLAAAALTATSCIQALLGEPPLIALSAITTIGAAVSAAHPAVLAGAGVLAALGLLLLGIALTPGTPDVLPLARGVLSLDTGVTRNSLAAALRSAAVDVDGVDKVRLKLTGARVTATVGTPLRGPGTLRKDVTAAIAARLDDIGPTRRPRVRVRVATTRST